MTVIIIAALVLAFVLVVLVLALNHRADNRSPSEVAHVLRALLEGTLDNRMWDRFVSEGIRVPALENIRSRCVSLWRRGSESLEANAIDPTGLSVVGRRQICDLLKECERLGGGNHAAR
jgi:hypothetical protein